MDLFDRLYNRRKEFYPPSLSEHVVRDKMAKYNLTDEDIQKAYRFGRLFRGKCEKPDKIGISRHDGKNNRTIVLIVRLMKDYARVVTVWVEPGRL